MPMRQRVLQFQGLYYCLTGMSPLVSMRFFERVTGKKRDRWLVQMVGLLAISIGGSLWVDSHSEEVEPASLVLSYGSALAFAAIDITHVSRRRISRIYLIDAALELLIVTLLAASRSA